MSALAWTLIGIGAALLIIVMILMLTQVSEIRRYLKIKRM